MRRCYIVSSLLNGVHPESTLYSVFVSCCDPDKPGIGKFLGFELHGQLGFKVYEQLSLKIACR